MNSQHSKSGLSLGIRKVSSMDLLDDEGKNTAIGKILQTREVRQTLGDILPDLLNAFAGDSRIRQFIMKFVGKYLNKILSRPNDIFEHKELQLLFEDERFIRNVVRPLPDIINGLFDVIVSMVGTVEQMPTDEKKEALGKLLSNMSTGQTGELINRFGRIMSDIYRDDPEFLTKTIGPGLAKLIDDTDFGDLKVFLEATFTDMTSLVKVINGALFGKPAKIVLLLTILPMLVNMIVKILKDVVERFNEFPPDLVADVILSLFREVNAKTVGSLSNETMELIRKISVGSALLGDPGMPQCRLDFAEFIEKFTAEIDLELLWKFNDAIAQSKERFDLSMLTVLKKNPAMVTNRLKNSPNLRNYRVKSANQKLGLLEKMPEKETFAALSEGISKIDANLMAEWVNLSSLIINRLNNSSPDLLPDLVEEFISTLDLYELEDTVKWTVENLGETLQPLGRILLPNFIKMAADWISTNGDEYDEELSQARETIVQFLNPKEVAA